MKRQIKPIILVDDTDKIVGFDRASLVHHHPVSLHRAISVIIFSPDRKKMLLQKRAIQKDTWPGFWSNTCCTHPQKGESVEEAAKRRLKEEMGFTTPLKRLFSFIYEAKYDDNWGEHEFDHVFVGEYEGEVKPSSEEIADYKWAEINELRADLQKNPRLYTPWFAIIFNELNMNSFWD